MIPMKPTNMPIFILAKEYKALQNAMKAGKGNAIAMKKRMVSIEKAMISYHYQFTGQFSTFESVLETYSIS